MIACFSCYSSQADVVALRVGVLFGNAQIARIDLCSACKVKIWSPWGMRK